MTEPGKGGIYLKWLEPAAVRRAQWAAAVAKERFIIAGVSFAAMLVLRAVSANPNSPGWPAAVGIALAAAVVFGFFMPWFMSLFPSQILVSVKGINRNAPRMWGQFGIFAIEFWGWEDIRRYSLGPCHLGRRTFRTITFFGDRGRLTTIGLGTKVSEADLAAVMQQHKVSAEHQAAA
jgi:hypothetical protein